MAKLVGTWMLVATAVAGAGRPHDASVSTDPAGAHVVIDQRGVYWELGSDRGPGHGGGSGGGGHACQRSWVSADSLPFPLPGSLPFGPPPSPQHRAFFVFCDGQYVGAVWLEPQQFAVVGSAPTAREIVERAARDLPYPPVTIEVNPSRRGLTGLTSWFWLDGYDGGVVRDTVRAFGVTVEVEATPGPVTWGFGDDSAPLADDSGRAGLTPDSPVTHTYESRSHDSPFTVRATMVLAVRARVDGGPWLAVDPVERDATREYEVVESRAQLVPVDG